MINTVEQNDVTRNDRRGLQSIIPATYGPASSWLTYPDWKRLNDRLTARLRHAAPEPAPDFSTALDRSELKAPVKFTLTVMFDHADSTRRVSMSKAALANMLGTSESTIKRHWKAAMGAGFLTRYDYPQVTPRPSDMWLWAGNAPKMDTYWDKFPDEPMTCSDGPAPF